MLSRNQLLKSQSMGLLRTNSSINNYSNSYKTNDILQEMKRSFLVEKQSQSKPKTSLSRAESHKQMNIPNTSLYQSLNIINNNSKISDDIKYKCKLLFSSAINTNSLPIRKEYLLPQYKQNNQRHSYDQFNPKNTIDVDNYIIPAKKREIYNLLDYHGEMNSTSIKTHKVSSFINKVKKRNENMSPSFFNIENRIKELMPSSMISPPLTSKHTSFRENKIESMKHKIDRVLSKKMKNYQRNLYLNRNDFTSRRKEDNFEKELMLFRKDLK